MNVTLYTDASFNPTRRTGGWAAWFKSDRGQGVAGGPLVHEMTKDGPLACELAAIANGVTVLEKRGMLLKGDRLVIVTDCTQAMEALEQRKRDPATTHVWKVVYRTKVGLCVRHVRAHQSGAGCRRSVVNNFVDAEAKRWRKEAERRADLTSPQGHRQSVLSPRAS